MIRLPAKVKVFSRRSSAGSITVFASLTLMLVASFLLTLLEAARVKGLDAYSQMHRENALESVLSEYDRDLFNRYGIFLLDGGYGTGELQFSEMNQRLQEISQLNLRPGASGLGLQAEQNFYQMDVAQADVSGYLLATDADGAAFRKMVAASMKARYPMELLKDLSGSLTDAENTMEQAQQSQSALEQAQSSIAEAKKQQAEQQSQSQSGDVPQQIQPSASPPENPMDVVKALKKKDILTLVLPSGARVSDKQLDKTQMLEQCTLLQGTESFQAEETWYETLLFQKFLQTQFGCFTDQKGGALDYELEYLQAGKTSDRANLKSVVNKLLLLREGANFLYLQTDAAKRAEARELALLLASAVGLAPAAALITQGILAAWAYVESILDVRTLLAGGKVPLTKTSATWRSNLSELASCLSGSVQTNTQGQGDDYAGYLTKLIYLKSKKQQAYRAMDLIALYKNTQCSDGTIQMNAMLLGVRAQLSYEAAPAFLDWVTLLASKSNRWRFSQEIYDDYFRTGNG